MGLKDWMAKNVAGVSGYGRVIGREALTSGLALGRLLYLGHGTRTANSEVFVFDDGEHLKSEDFALYCSDDLLNQPPMEDSSELSKHTRCAGIAFAAQCAITAGFNFMSEQNSGAFNKSMGSSLSNELLKVNSGITSDLILRYIGLPRPAGVSQVLNLQKPGAGDQLSVYLEAAAKHGQNRTVGFRRTGVAGFDAIAIPLAQETVIAISTAAKKFAW